MVPDAADTEPPLCAWGGASAPQQPDQALVDVPPSEAADDPAPQHAADAPAWLPAALERLQSTAVVCGEDADGAAVIGRRVAFALLGELTVGELVLTEGLHVGRCTVLAVLVLLIIIACGRGAVYT